MCPKVKLDKSNKVVLLGPSKSAVSGVSTHLNQLFNSSLSHEYCMLQFQVGSEGRNNNVIKNLWRFATSPILFFFFLIKYKPIIVHVNSSLEPKAFWRDLAYVIIGKLLCKKIVYQVHGGKLPQYFLGSNIISHIFLRWSLGLSDALVLLAQVEKVSYEKFGKFKKVVVIPNAIELEDYKNIKGINLSNDYLNLGYIGRLADDKGILESVKALSVLKDRGIKNFKYRIAGSGPVEDILRNMVIEEDLADVVEFIPPIFGDKKIRFWEETDLFLFPTYHHEGLPYTVLESLASGTPMITTRIGGIPDVVTDGVHAIFVEPHDHVGVADAIALLLADRKKLHDMSALAAERAREHYGIERLATQFSELYRDVLE